MNLSSHTVIRSTSRVSFGTASAIPDVPSIPAPKTRNTKTSASCLRRNELRAKLASKQLSMVPEEPATPTGEPDQKVEIWENATAWKTQPAFTMNQARPTITTVGAPMVSPNWGMVGNMPAVVSGGNYGGVTIAQNTLQSMMTPFMYQQSHNMPYVIDVFARGCKLRWGARECALEIRVGNYHVCTDWAPASKMPRWDVYLGPFGICAQMNERIIISILGRGPRHGAKILDMLDIPVRKLYNKGCYVKREFGMDRNNCKVQLEISMKSSGMMGGGNMMGGGVVMPMGHLMTGGGFGSVGNIVWA